MNLGFVVRQDNKRWDSLSERVSVCFGSEWVTTQNSHLGSGHVRICLYKDFASLSKCACTQMHASDYFDESFLNVSCVYVSLSTVLIPWGSQMNGWDYWMVIPGDLYSVFCLSLITDTMHSTALWSRLNCRANYRDTRPQTGTHTFTLSVSFAVSNTHAHADTC